MLISLTVDFDAVLELSAPTLDRLAATMHQNGFPHPSVLYRRAEASESTVDALRPPGVGDGKQRPQILSDFRDDRLGVENWCELEAQQLIISLTCRRHGTLNDSQPQIILRDAEPARACRGDILHAVDRWNRSVDDIGRGGTTGISAVSRPHSYLDGEPVGGAIDQRNMGRPL